MGTGRRRAMVLMTVVLACGCTGKLLQPVAIVVSAAQQATIGSVTNFGDSITCGYIATPADGSGALYSTHGYASLLDDAIGRPSANYCRGGDQAADVTVSAIYPHTVPMAGAAELYTVMVGVNDANVCGASNGCLQNWDLSLSAGLAWLCLPAGDKVLASSSTSLTGQWTTDLGIGMSSTANGSSLSLKVQQAVAGRSLYVAYRVFDPSQRSGGAALLVVDGEAVSVLSSAPQTGHAIATQNGATDTVFLAQVPLGAVGPHTVTVTVTSPSGEEFSILWAGASTQDYSALPGSPRVVIGQVTETLSDRLNTIAPAYNSLLSAIVAGFVAEGMDMRIAPTSTSLIYDLDFSDSLHPNNDGHRRLAATFAATI